MLFVGDGGDLPEIKEAVKKKGLDGVVHFVGRVDDRDELVSYFTRSDLFIFLSTYDNAPLVIREAAACACPALVVEGSSTAEMIDDGVTGYCVREHAESVADAVEKIFTNESKLIDVGVAASEQVYLTWDNAVERSIDRYKEVKQLYDDRRARKPLRNYL